MSAPAVAPEASMLPLLLASSCAFMNLFATQPILPMLAEQFGAGKVRVSLTVTGPAIAVALAAPVMGRISDRIGRKRTMKWAGVLLSIATLLASTATSLDQLIFWRFLQGAFTPGVFSVTVAYINEEWPAHRVGQAMAMFGTGGVIGSCFGRTMSGVIAGHWSWRLGFLFLGSMNLIWALLLARLLPKENKFVAANKSDSFSVVADLLRNRRLVATYGVGFCIMFSIMAIFTYVNFHLAAPPYRMNAAALGYVFLVYLLGGVLTPVAGRWIDRLGMRNALLISTGVAICGALLTLGHSVVAIVLGLAIFSSALFISQASSNSHIGRVVEHSQALAAGMYGTAYYLGGCAGSVLPGLAWDFGGWSGCVLLIVAVQILGGLIGFLFWTSSPVVAAGGSSGVL